MSTARRRVVETLRSTTDHITGNRFAHIEWKPPRIALENVCPRPGFDYLLTSPTDVELLRTAASELKQEDLLAFTCDVGHADRPVEMLEAMRTPASIHLHGVCQSSTVDVADNLPGDVGPDALSVEPANETISHLPPNRFPERALDTFGWIDESDHGCPLVIELQRACKTAAVATELCDWIDDHR